MKVILFGENSESVRPLIEESGFEIVESNPEFVISYGGDGTLMRAETAHPCVPKILLRNSVICKKCSALTNEEVLQKVIKGDYKTEKLMKLEATAKNVTLRALNDIIVHNKNPRTGIRYKLCANGKSLGPSEREIIGDGIVAATPYGSTAYYRSITDSYFEVGIGVAFNNSTEQADHIIIKEDSVLTLEVTRGPALVFKDNDPKEIELEIGDKVEIKKSEEFAEIVIPTL